MFYVVLVFAGAAAAASTLLILYLPYIARLREERRVVAETATRLQAQSEQLAQQAAEYERYRQQKVQYDDLLRENNGLKQDLFNLSVQLRKTERDQAAITRRQEDISRLANELGSHYLRENVAWIGDAITPNNFASCKQRLLKVIEACRGIGLSIPTEQEEQLIEDLKKEYEEAVRREFQREEQARIRAQIREEERLQREADKLVQDAQREQAIAKAALEKALALTKDEHSAEVESLRAKLKEAEEKAQRAISQAQMTKAGYVYVLSNIGSFGEGVFKVGMTRRLEPMDRVRELSDASVPFEFDVHMMISCKDAPSLENALHRELHRQRLNKVNFRKEFFRTDIECIRHIVELQHGEVEYVGEPAALQYRESLNTTDEDYDFMERTMESVTEGKDGSAVED